MFLCDNDMALFSRDDIDLKPNDKRWHVLLRSLQIDALVSTPPFIKDLHFWGGRSPEYTQCVKKLIKEGDLVRHKTTPVKFRIDEKAKGVWLDLYKMLPMNEKNILEFIHMRLKEICGSEYHDKVCCMPAIKSRKAILFSLKYFS